MTIVAVNWLYFSVFALPIPITLENSLKAQSACVRAFYNVSMATGNEGLYRPMYEFLLPETNSKYAIFIQPLQLILFVASIFFSIKSVTIHLAQSDNLISCIHFGNWRTQLISSINTSADSIVSLSAN